MEHFILNTLWVYEILITYLLIVKVFWGCLTLTSIVLFIYHLQFYYDVEFFMENVDVLGEFSMASYKSFMVIIAIVPIFSIIVIIWSVFESLNSRKFLTRFGCP